MATPGSLRNGCRHDGVAPVTAVLVSLGVRHKCATGQTVNLDSQITKISAHSSLSTDRKTKRQLVIHGFCCISEQRELQRPARPRPAVVRWLAVCSCMMLLSPPPRPLLHRIIGAGICQLGIGSNFVRLSLVDYLPYFLATWARAPAASCPRPWRGMIMGN